MYILHFVNLMKIDEDLLPVKTWWAEVTINGGTTGDSVLGAITYSR